MERAVSWDGDHNEKALGGHLPSWGRTSTIELIRLGHIMMMIGGHKHLDLSLSYRLHFSPSISPSTRFLLAAGGTRLVEVSKSTNHALLGSIAR
jgi:hypothetical protein